MTFPSGNTKDENDAFFNNYGAVSSGSGQYVNRVYFGTTKSPAAKGTIRGQQINISTTVDNTLSINEAKKSSISTKESYLLSICFQATR